MYNTDKEWHVSNPGQLSALETGQQSFEMGELASKLTGGCKLGHNISTIGNAQKAIKLSVISKLYAVLPTYSGGHAIYMYVYSTYIYVNKHVQYIPSGAVSHGS